MNKNNVDSHWAKQVCRGLDKQAAQLDAATVRRLRHARQAALGRDKPIVSVRKRRVSEWLGQQHNRFVYHGIFASVLVLSISLFVALSLPGRGMDLTIGVGAEHVVETETELNELDVLMSNEDIEFLENLEIYEWLVAEYG